MVSGASPHDPGEDLRPVRFSAFVDLFDTSGRRRGQPRRGLRAGLRPPGQVGGGQDGRRLAPGADPRRQRLSVPHGGGACGVGAPWSGRCDGRRVGEEPVPLDERACARPSRHPHPGGPDDASSSREARVTVEEPLRAQDGRGRRHTRSQPRSLRSLRQAGRSRSHRPRGDGTQHRRRSATNSSLARVAAIFVVLVALDESDSSNHAGVTADLRSSSSRFSSGQQLGGGYHQLGGVGQIVVAEPHDGRRDSSMWRAAAAARAASCSVIATRFTVARPRRRTALGGGSGATTTGEFDP